MACAAGQPAPAGEEAVSDDTAGPAFSGKGPAKSIGRPAAAARAFKTFECVKMNRLFFNLSRARQTAYGFALRAPTSGREVPFDTCSRSRY